MSKQWWSSRAGFLTQGVCLLALFAWSVHHAPNEAGKPAPVKTSAPASPASTVDMVIDNSEDTASTDGVSGTGARFVAPPPPIRFHTEHPPAGSLNLRPLEHPLPAPWQPVHPQNPPQRLPGGPQSPFEVNRGGATVYNAPPQDAD